MLFKFNSSRFPKLIKATARDRKLSVAYEGNHFFLTDTHWIAKVPAIDNKILTAIASCFGFIEKGTGKGTVQPNTMLSVWEKLTTEKQINGKLTKWLYSYDNDDPSQKVNIIKADRIVLIDSQYLDVIEDPTECEITVQPNNPRSPIIFWDFEDPFFLVYPIILPEDRPLSTEDLLIDNNLATPV
jgi:hypothetical protein